MSASFSSLHLLIPSDAAVKLLTTRDHVVAAALYFGSINRLHFKVHVLLFLQIECGWGCYFLLWLPQDDFFFLFSTQEISLTGIWSPVLVQSPPALISSPRDFLPSFSLCVFSCRESAVTSSRSCSASTVVSSYVERTPSTRSAPTTLFVSFHRIWSFSVCLSDGTYPGYVSFLTSERHFRNGGRACQWDGTVPIWSTSCKCGFICR